MSLTVTRELQAHLAKNVKSRRLRYAATHLIASALVVGIFLSIVATVWYPPPLLHLQGAVPLLVTLAVVDVCLGPLTTLIIAGPRKPRSELRRDLSIIVFVQLTALAYGAWTIYSGRPAFLVFSADRFDVVAATDVETELRGKPVVASFSPSLLGSPQWVFAREPESNEDRSDIMLSAALGGPDIKNYPQLYDAWPGEQDTVRKKLRPLSELRAKSEMHRANLDAAAARSGRQVGDLSWLAIVGRVERGVVLIDNKDLTIVDTLGLPPE